MIKGSADCVITTPALPYLLVTYRDGYVAFGEYGYDSSLYVIHLKVPAAQTASEHFYAYLCYHFCS